MIYDFKKLNEAIKDTTEHYKNELTTIRTGRAIPSILDGVKIDSYGTKVSLNQVAGITIEDSRTLRVSPWDIDTVHQIEQSIQDANLGVSVSSDEKGVRVSFPELTSERREQLIKLTNSKLEEARVSLRRYRDDTWNDIQKKQKNSELSEDDKFRFKDEMEKNIKDGNKNLEDLAKKKETELTS